MPALFPAGAPTVAGRVPLGSHVNFKSQVRTEWKKANGFNAFVDEIGHILAVSLSGAATKDGDIHNLFPQTAYVLCGQVLFDVRLSQVFGTQ